ncbi:MAG: hypothetical protein Q9180_007301 [Flavoplaca navasiana]
MAKPLTWSAVPTLWRIAQSLDLPDRLDAEKAVAKDLIVSYFKSDDNFNIDESGSFPPGYFAPGAPLEGILEQDHTAVYKVMRSNGRGLKWLHTLVIYAHGDEIEGLFEPLQKAAGKMLRMTYIRTTLLTAGKAFVMFQIGTKVAFFAWYGEPATQEWVRVAAVR